MFLVVCTDLLKCEHFLTALCGRNQYFWGMLYFILVRIFFIVTLIMLRLTCKLSMVQKTDHPCQTLLNMYSSTAALTWCCKPFCLFVFIVHRHIVCLRCCWNYRECSQTVINNDSKNVKTVENYIQRTLRFRLLT